MNQSDQIQFQWDISRSIRKNPPPYKDLMPFFLDKKLWEAAWKKVRQAEGANTPGVDGETCHGISSRVHQWLGSLHHQVSQGKYTPQNVLKIAIPKSSGNVSRQIGILTIKDRVVQTALKFLLEPIFESRFHQSSFGFRPGRSVAAALNAVCRTVTEEQSNELTYPYAVHLDVANCFPTIDHTVLLHQFSLLVADAELTGFLQRMLDAGATKTGFLYRRSIGLVQGGALSPLLCNFYLHGIDEAMEVFCKNHFWNLQMFRYADDILLVGKTPQILENGIRQIKQLLKERHQKLGNDISVCPIENCNWLGVRFQTYSNPWNQTVSFGYILQEDKVRKMLSEITDMTMPPSDRIDSATFDLGQWIVSINRRLNEWYNTIVFAKNATEIFETLDNHISERVGFLFKSVLKIRNKELFQKYRIKLPRGFSTWEINGNRLKVLSSLPPKRPVGLVHSPPWEQNKKKTTPLPFSKTSVITIGRKAK